MATSWIKNYYGTAFDSLSPEVLEEGKKWALVRIRSVSTRGSSSIGYVIIKKTGSHQSSSYHSVHEGLPTNAEMDKMRARLREVDK